MMLRRCCSFALLVLVLVLVLVLLLLVQGYGMVPNITTWGGNAIFDGEKHHLFVSRMTNNCSLEHWGRNSRIDHAVSTTGVEGPYEFVDVAVNTWAHNAAPLALPDGTFAIIHIGDGSGSPTGGDNCTNGNTEHAESIFGPQRTAAAAGAVHGSAGVVGSTIHVAKTLDGPWEPLTNDLGRCNNPAPWVHPNGTIYVG